MPSRHLSLVSCLHEHAVRAMILAAGLGVRLRPLTETLPKPLLPVAGRPLIVWNLLLLRRYGLTEAIINLHHLGHLIEQELGNGSSLGMRLTYSREPVLLGTGGGLKQAEPFLGGEPFLVLNSDTLLEIDLSAMMAAHRAGHALATMALRADADADRWGVLEVDGSNRIVRINGRGRQPEGAVRKRMFAGVHIVHPRLLAAVPAGRQSSIIEAYVGAIQGGETIQAYEFSGYWSDIGTPERYAQAQRDAENGAIDLTTR
ncbi:MAG: NDP-sugar synthase [Nitrospira sp.]|nr:NDP-sugar synthase [Nitrospira sp.]